MCDDCRELRREIMNLIRRLTMLLVALANQINHD